jgi:hypothetical protein
VGTSFTTLLALIFVLGAGAGAEAQSPEERAAARELVARRSEAIVMVLATVKTRMNIGGREATRDQSVQANATVLDPTGLAVMALSVLEPGEIANRTMGPGGVSTEISDLRMRRPDGQEIPAKVVLRDSDLDLVFVKPTEPPSAPMPAVDAPSGVPALLDVLVVLQRTGETTGWRPLATLSYVQMTVDRPRTYHALSVTPALGAAVFDTRGRFVGIIVRVGGARTNPLPAVLPADDIREVAGQAK